MRKIWIVVLVVMLAAFSFAMAQEIHWADQITVEWDAPEFLVDGTPIPAEDVIAYNMYLRPENAPPIPERDSYDTIEEYKEAYTNYLAEYSVGTVSVLQYTYTLPEGIHEAGISAVRYIGGAGSPFESIIIWSFL